MNSIGSAMNLALSAAVLSAPLLLATGTSARADTEAPNRAHVTTGIVEGGLYRGCYAKSAPDTRSGMRGTTSIYEVRRGKDRLIVTYKWYAKRLYLRCRRDADGAMTVTVVRFGPWQRGHQASKAHLAIAFYTDGRELARYSTLDLAGRPDNVRRSVSHYRVIRQVTGFDDQNSFGLVLTDRRRLTFNLSNGTMRRGK